MSKIKKFFNSISNGPIKYEFPENIDYLQIDKKLRKTIYNINKSNWCWTIWSCQGHIFDDRDDILPYISFIVDNRYVSLFLTEIIKTLPFYSIKDYPVASNAQLSIVKGYSDKNFTIFSVYWSSDFIDDNNKYKYLHISLKKISKNIRNFHAK